MALGNTATRIIVSLVAIPLIVAVCFIGKLPFLGLALLIGGVSYFEFAGMVENKNGFVNLFLGTASVIFLIINTYFSLIQFYDLMIIITVLILLAELYRNKESAIINSGTTVLGIFYIGLFSSSLVGIREFYPHSEILYSQGGYLIIALLFSIWICDSAAFFIGTAIGKHKLFPRVSPNKSWEGAVAGFVFAVIAMLAAKFFFLEFLSTIDAIAIGAIVGIIGQYGDLVESLVKRDAGVKDSSALIPGHGGIFDRFDSLLFSAPLVYLYIKFIA
ncbi:MAG: phosphatidate cytidylyltransferase [Melioribacteraceae bacterium]|nr:phosphatidate cytidylyltransferase [Melioribacteraceae bacterium]MCF8392808.1 phosphatidate cytidylyltransferase [Melioribacteraceae bacterium]MCF8418706.1 phosphatidate cytidylyltransferase [Melioribacteraceae bacterium]